MTDFKKVVPRPPLQPVPLVQVPTRPTGFQLPSPVATYKGAFGVRQAERLLWRAGFGPSPGQAAAFAGMGLHRAVAALTRPTGGPTFTGAAPTDGEGPLAPNDVWGHEMLWWLDRMMRTNQPLVERMTLVWHDWFATSLDGVSQANLMLAQNDLFRRYAFGSFDGLIRDVTKDGAMILWLNLSENRSGRPNENYARELMELFTLGADRGAYTEDDVRDLARALTGFRYTWSSTLGAHDFRFDPTRHDTNAKTIFGFTGNFGWEQAVAMCVRHRLHASFFVDKLWGNFIPTPPSAADRAALERAYVQGGFQVRPVLEAILLHPQLHTGARMVKPPVVFLAGMLRALRRSVDTIDWVWLSEHAGQRLFMPPDVSGWDDEHWLDTGTVGGRWRLVQYGVWGRQIPASAFASYSATETPGEALAAARAFWNDPDLTPETVSTLAAFASRSVPANAPFYEVRRLRAMRQNALRHLIYSSPDLQVS